MSTSMGVLSCLTSAWWGSLSDRYGRTRLMCLAVTGLVALDINFLIVNLFADRLPGGYWFLIIGPLIDGCVGGVAFADASIQAYLSDCVDRNSRSRVFALSLGLASAGGAVGPIIGAFLLRFTQRPLSVYYLIALIHVVQMLMLGLAPESLSYSQMAAARLQHAERQRVASRDQQRSGKLNVLLVRFLTCLRKIKHQNPFSVLMPAVSEVNSIKKWSNDWSLCLVAGSYGLMILVDESYLYQYQFAAAAFGWSSEAINVNVSLWGGVRALHLVVLLPAIIKLLKPKPSSPSIDAQTINSSSLTPTLLAKPHNLRSAASFDLALSRISLFVLVFAYLIIALDGTPWAFNTFTVLGALSSGFLPAVQSIALELHANRTSGREESGKLLGVLSLVRALGSQIIGPAFYGFTYLKTVAIFPRAIFVVSTIIVGIGFVLLIFVKVPKESSNFQLEEESELDANEALLEEQRHDDGDDGDGRGVFAL
ncbi:hypothetical protein SERLADRAFT_355952 [Serpula lacrymans var. lacrymans S7.9]|uniref:Major facilitator superfamily (MFS) profile domain-containing protein n=1 Tax=Serpula lacrymans var. lacrymans (strain S7.9) TaxID=578457 RepID=F8NXX7_SERL9|nr:uncharacterized protein SERLADRAFT_355952 [Serpula lacrymans var. lacrymans S7.9]EGO24169.1 hypothetical protein SERLADRAFT_355952 [Serpula lacrymans var. lacrymans S7.9]